MSGLPGSGRLTGRVVIVTGAGGGIGSRTCVALAAEGAVVAAVDRHRARVDAVLAALPTAASAAGFSLDVRDEQAVDGMVRAVLDRFGRLDALVHCAGILRFGGGTPRPLGQLTTREWDEVLDVNLKGTFLCNRAVLPAMMARRSGHIVNLSSTSGRQGRAFDAPYCASKFGVIGLSQSVAEEVRHFGIKVHVVMPDAVDTPLWEQNGPIPAPENALPPDRVADLICYLLTLPDDTVLEQIVIAPFGSRRRKRPVRAEPAAAGGAAAPPGKNEHA